MQKPRQRRNGERMSNVSIRFVIGRDQLIGAIALALDQKFTNEISQRYLSKGACEKALRTALTNGGMEALDYWPEHVTQDDVDKLRNHATELTHLHFPEFFTEATR